MKRTLKKILPILLILSVIFVGVSMGHGKVSEYIFEQQEIKSFKEKGGVEMILQVDMNGIPDSEKNQVFQASKDIIFRRIRLLGFYPLIQSSPPSSDYKITVQMANVENLDSLANIIGYSAQLSFWEEGDNEVKATESQTTAKPPENISKILGENSTKTELSGRHIKIAKVVTDSNGQPQVQIEFTDEGRKLFTDITQRNVGGTLAIVLDNNVLSAPKINEPITTGNAIVGGNFTQEQAKTLSIELNAGTLHAPIKVLEKKYVKGNK